MATSTTTFGLSKPSTSSPLSGKNPTSRVATTKPCRSTILPINKMVLDSPKPLNAAPAASTSTIPVANGGFISRFAPDEPRKGADVLVEALERAGATDVFSYPGGASMEIHQALAKSLTVRNILCRHEQGEIFAAEGYARASSRPGVCIATSRPGAPNLVSDLADALLDSVPLVAITGQVPRRLIGTDAFPETPIVEVTRTVTKRNYLVLDVEDIPRIEQEAFVLAVSGRPGPVLIDIQQKLLVPTWDKPKDIQQHLLVPTWDKSMQLHRFAEPTGISVASTFMGLVGTYPLDDPFSLSHPGSNPTTRFATTRNMVPDSSKWLTAATDTSIIEHNYMEIGGDGAIILAGSPPLTPPGPARIVIYQQLPTWGKPMQFHGYRMLGMHGTVYANYAVHEADFSARIEVQEKKRCPLWFKTVGEAIPPHNAIKVWYEWTHGAAIITTGVGQRQVWAAWRYVFKGSSHWATSNGLGPVGFDLRAAKRQMWAEQWYGFNGPSQWATSSGLSAMGFGLPAAIVVCAVIKKLGMVKDFVFITQKLLEILLFFQTRHVTK